MKFSSMAIFLACLVINGKDVFYYAKDGMQANQHEKDFKAYRVCDWVKSIELYTRKNGGEYAKIAGFYK